MKKKVLLTLWLILPFVAVGLLISWIFTSLAAGPAMDAPAVGQGARDTGDANGLGELLTRSGIDPFSDEPAALPIGAMLVVRDETGLASEERPIYLACAQNGDDPADPDWKLEIGPDGRWFIDLPASDTPFEFELTLGSWETREIRTETGADQKRYLPRSMVVGRSRGDRPMLEVTVEARESGVLVEP